MKKVLKMFFVLLLVTSITGCKAEEEKEETVEPSVVIKEPIVEIVDEEIENIQYYLDALEYLGFQDIDIKKNYSLEELTVYLMELFGKQDEAMYSNYQCPYSTLKAESQNIISYAYANWYLTGIINEELIYPNSHTANNFIAEVLRLLGYKDYGDERDFVLGNKENDKTNAIDFALSLGLDFNPNTGKVRGDYLAKVLWDALEIKNKDEVAVKDILRTNGMFSKKEYEDATYLVKGEEIPAPEIKIEVYTNNEVYQPQEQVEQYSYNDYSSEDQGGSYQEPSAPAPVEPPAPPAPVDPPAPPEEPSGQELESGSQENETPLVEF